MAFHLNAIKRSNPETKSLNGYPAFSLYLSHLPNLRLFFDLRGRRLLGSESAISTIRGSFTNFKYSTYQIAITRDRPQAEYPTALATCTKGRRSLGVTLSSTLVCTDNRGRIPLGPGLHSLSKSGHLNEFLVAMKLQTIPAPARGIAKLINRNALAPCSMIAFSLFSFRGRG